MKIFTQKMLITISAALLVGCGNPQPQAQKSTFIVMKMSSIKYADQGFVSTGGGTTNVEIYSSGSAVMRLEISGSSVCSGRFACISKREFNRRFMSKSYPKDTIGQIFRGEKIFGGIGTSREPDGFTQKIYKNGIYSIKYSVLNGSIIFRDTINNILIKVRYN